MFKNTKMQGKTIYWEKGGTTPFLGFLNMGLPLKVWARRTVHGMETHWLSSKEKVLGAAVRKESHADSCVRHERIHHY